MDAVLREDFAGLRFRGPVRYDPDLLAMGSTNPRTGLTRLGRNLDDMGMSNFERRAVLRDTLLEEAIHQRLWRRRVPSPHHHDVAAPGLPYPQPGVPVQDAYINRVIQRYFQREGWELSPARAKNIERFGTGPVQR